MSKLAALAAVGRGWIVRKSLMITLATTVHIPIVFAILDQVAEMIA